MIIIFGLAIVRSRQAELVSSFPVSTFLDCNWAVISTNLLSPIISLPIFDNFAYKCCDAPLFIFLFFEALINQFLLDQVLEQFLSLQHQLNYYIIVGELHFIPPDDASNILLNLFIFYHLLFGIWAQNVSRNLQTFNSGACLQNWYEKLYLGLVSLVGWPCLSI